MFLRNQSTVQAMSRAFWNNKQLSTHYFLNNATETKNINHFFFLFLNLFFRLELYVTEIEKKYQQQHICISSLSLQLINYSACRVIKFEAHGWDSYMRFVRFKTIRPGGSVSWMPGWTRHETCDIRNLHVIRLTFNGHISFPQPSYTWLPFPCPRPLPRALLFHGPGY